MHNLCFGDHDGLAVMRNTVVDRMAHNLRDTVLPAYLVGQESLDTALLLAAGMCSAGKRERPMFIVSFGQSLQQRKLLLGVAGYRDMHLDQIAKRDSLVLDSTVHLVAEDIGCCSTDRPYRRHVTLIRSGQGMRMEDQVSPRHMGSIRLRLQAIACGRTFVVLTQQSPSG